MQSKNHDLQTPPPTIHLVFSSSRILPPPSPLSSSLVAYLHNRVSCTPPPLPLSYPSFCVPEITTHYHTRRHCASSSLNCFPVSPPQRHVLAAIHSLKCENDAGECYLFFLRARVESTRQGGETESAAIYEWSPGW